MSGDSRIIELLSDVRERVIKMETRLEVLPELQATVAKHEKEIVKAKTAVNLLRWLAGIAFVAIPASVYAVVRTLKG